MSVAAFGFCEYKEPESTLRALRLLHDLQIGDKNLLVKVDAKTKAQLDEWKAKKKTANGVIIYIFYCLCLFYVCLFFFHKFLLVSVNSICIKCFVPGSTSFSGWRMSKTSKHVCLSTTVTKLFKYFPGRIQRLRMEETTRKRF